MDDEMLAINESSEDDDDNFIDLVPEASNTSDMIENDEFIFEVLSLDQVVNLMVDMIKQVRQVVQIPATTTRILLNHFKWDKEKLIETYYESDQEQIFSDAHLISPSRKNVLASNAKNNDSNHNFGCGYCLPFFKERSSEKSPKAQKKESANCSYAVDQIDHKAILNAALMQAKREMKSKSCVNERGEYLCEICYVTVPEQLMSGLECGHKFCLTCWTNYLTTKIMDEGMGQTISCAAHNCDILVDDVTVMKLVNDPKVKLKYQHLITNSFVECNRLLRWCPKPDCGHVIKGQSVSEKAVKCACGHQFCFYCSQNWHDPVKCNLLKKWIKKCDDDSETSNWIAANTKECPKCRSIIEKDGGCNHMVCKKCRFDFCWVCLGAWEPHGSSWYNCNKYDENDAKKARSAQEKSRAALQRYLFYCNRYMNHMQSLRLENKLYASISEKMQEMQLHNMSWIEVQFLKKAVDVLCQCRQTLMHTYVFAFYLKKNNQSMIFEDNQKDLEQATEQLSEYLERDITQEVLKDIKQKVQDKSRYCENRRTCLTKHVHEGYENDSWEYLDSV